jgi:hypothetical protein
MKNKKKREKIKSKEKNHNLIICRNVIDLIVFGEKEKDNYNNRKDFEIKKSTDKISNKYKKLLPHRNTKSISHQKSKLLLELSEEKKI